MEGRLGRGNPNTVRADKSAAQGRRRCLLWGGYHFLRFTVNRHSTVTHNQRPTVTQLQEGGTGGEVSEILFFSAKSKRPPSLIYSMQIIPVCLSIVARRKGVSATRRGGLNWTPISLLVGHPCKLFHTFHPSVALILALRRIARPFLMGKVCESGDPRVSICVQR